MFKTIRYQLYIYKQIPSSIWALGFVSLCTDMSSELIKSLLPTFLLTVLGAPITALGFIEGIAEATALITKIGSGILSDIIRKRKILVVIGYSLAALSKILFPLSRNVHDVLFARFFDRVAKGIRGTPRDALIGDLAPAHVRGASFGLRESLDTIGAIIGPILAIVLMIVFKNNVYPVLWIAAIPGIASVIILLVAVPEPSISGPVSTKSQSHRWSFRSILTLDRKYWHIIIISIFLSLARLSEAFLILKAQTIGLSISWLPLVMVIMSCVYALAAYPAGALSDIFSRHTILFIGTVCLIFADILLSLTTQIVVFFLGIIFWGLYMGLSQGILVAMITDVTQSSLRGTAYGIYNATAGIALLIANISAGFLWQTYGSHISFLYSALCASCAGIGLMMQYKHKYHNHHI
ncbi:MAG TPA: MFS transporter [Candidatus Babeliales bacterium]|jgi:MFS family permease|nr:MFS transporter [Candidatus Babeliales bacterium]